MEKSKQQIDRRTFVKASSLAMGGVLLTPSMMSAKAHIDGDDVIKIGLIGCGGRGTGAALQALKSQQNVKLVAMADAFRDQLDKSYSQISDPSEWVREDEPVDLKGRIEVPEENKFDGFDAYKKLIPLVDVVVIATPPGFRPTHFEAAVKAGKHVFMEKPLAVDAPGVRKVLAAAEIAKQKKLNVVVGLQRHYQKKYQQWVELLHNGAIGDILAARVYWNGAGVWVRERKPGMTEMQYQMRNWYYFNWLCGDHINEQHIHNLDVGNWVMQGYPLEAQGIGGRLVRTGKEYGEIYDHHYVEYMYEGGRMMASQCKHMKNTANKVSEAFHGTNGSAPKPGVILTKSGYSLLDYNDKKDTNPYQVEHDLLFEAIAKGEYKFADADNGAKSTLTAIMGRMATYSGQVITWEQALNSTMDLMPKKLAWDADPQVLPNADGYYPHAIPGETKVI